VLKTTAAAFVLAMLGGAAFVSASMPNADGTISGCVNDATGVVRIIDTAKPGTLGRCISAGVLRETALAWNVAGRAGAPGPAGPAGPAGVGRIVLGEEQSGIVHPGVLAHFDVRCPDSAIPIGRNYRNIGGYGANPTILFDGQNADAPGWYLIVRNDDSFDATTIVVQALCADLAP